MAAGDPGAGGALPALAEEACRASGAAVGLAVRAVETAEDTRVEVAAVGPWGASESNQTAFLGGSEGRRRAGIAAAAFLNGILRDQPGSRPRSKPPSTGGQ
jgi:hypothetical protein